MEKTHFQAEVQLKDIMTLDNIEKISCECSYVSPILVVDGQNSSLEVEISTLGQHANYDTRFKTATRMVAVLEPADEQGYGKIGPNIGPGSDNDTFTIWSDFNKTRITLAFSEGRYNDQELLDEFNRLIRYNPALSSLRAGGVPPYLNADLLGGKIRVTNLDNADTTKYSFYFGANSAYQELGFDRYFEYGPFDLRNPPIVGATPLVAPRAPEVPKLLVPYAFKHNLGKFNLNKEHLNSHIWDVKVRYLDDFYNNLFGAPIVFNNWVGVFNFAY